MALRIVALILALTASASANNCPLFEAMRCRKNTVQLCDDHDYRVRWTHYDTCAAPDVCIEDEPYRARCGRPGKLAKLGRKISYAAATVMIGAYVITRAIRGR